MVSNNQSAPQSLEECKLTDEETIKILKWSPGWVREHLPQGLGKLVLAQLHSPKLLAYIQHEKDEARREGYEQGLKEGKLREIEIESAQVPQAPEWDEDK
jgi:hypothetical protein